MRPRLQAMETQSYKTTSANAKMVQRKWYVIDAEQAVVGRLASRVATILRGKHKPIFTHMWILATM